MAEHILLIDSNYEEAEGFVTRMGRVLEPLEDHWVCHILDCDREGARVI